MKRVFLLLFLLLSVLPAHAQLVQITSMRNFSFGSWSGSGDLHDSDQVCIYRSSGGTNYRITASGSGAGSSFRVANGGANIAYEVRWQPLPAGSLTSLTAASPTGFSGASNSINCGGSTNALLDITITESALSAAASGSYSGTLSILLEPN
jgi:hypothetical protein